ncbi:hypothetical protein OUZ56_026442 [Daphnia magna]|uniref:Uncharacterized protein n=1 Tax=Daphnia magna TaxID=35525 RepID=A0ABQ9ZLR9_9CRUS|nr:hypothetical protein OUZ56_026442 [Daphnia magna]
MWPRYQENELSTMDLLEEIILQLKIYFPFVISDHQLNLNQYQIDDYDTSLHFRMIPIQKMFDQLASEESNQHQPGRVLNNALSTAKPAKAFMEYLNRRNK